MSAEIVIEKVFQEYKNKIYRLAISLVRNDRDAEDVLQNTFIKIIKNIHNFRNQSSLSTWIYRIAYNESLMLLRRRSSQLKAYNRINTQFKKAPAGIFVNWSKVPDQQLLNKELRQRIDASIRGLPLKYRMPLLLRHVQQLPIETASSILGIKKTSFKTRLHRSQGMISLAMADYFKDKLGKDALAGSRCSLQRDFIYKFTQNKLETNRQEAFKKHIADCKACTDFLKAYSQAISITQALECKDIPAALQAKMESFLFTHKQ